MGNKPEPDSPDLATRLAQAEALAAGGKKKAAVQALMKLGNALQSEGKTLEAIAALKKAQQIDPKEEVEGTFLVRIDLERLVKEARRKVGAPPSPVAARRPPHEVTSAPAEAEARQRREALRRTIAGIPLLKDLPPVCLELILQKTRERSVEAGEPVFVQGSDGDSLFFVASGELAVRAPDDTGREVEMATLGPGDVTGEISFISGVPRTASLVAKRKSELLELERNAIDPIVRRHRALSDALATLFRERVLDGVLARSRLFRSLSRDARDDVARRLVPISVEAGQPIVTEGTAGSTLYILHRGEVRVSTTRSKKGKEVQLAILKPHEVFGDLALILGTARTATVTALTAADLLCLEKGDLEELLAENPQVRAALVDIQLERFVGTAQILGKSS